MMNSHAALLGIILVVLKSLKMQFTSPQMASSLWVIHGDYFDGVIQCAKWLAYVGR